MNRVSSHDRTEWEKITEGKTFITDLGKGDKRYAAWVYLNKQHHIAEVGSDINTIKKKFKVADDLVFAFHAKQIISQNSNTSKPIYNLGNRRNNRNAKKRVR